MSDDDNENEFELGEGDGETEATVTCPHCGESVEITLDPSGGDAQEYFEDCELCSGSWSVTVHYDVEGKAEVEVTSLDDE